MTGEPSYPSPYLDPTVDADLRSHFGKWVVAGADVRVGPDAEIEDSVLHARVRVETGAKVTNSILGEGSVIGAGATLSGVVTGLDAQVEPGATLTDEKVPAET
jgi:NDP-sugar pyrophosphorylase family protein